MDDSAHLDSCKVSGSKPTVKVNLKGYNEDDRYAESPALRKPASWQLYTVSGHGRFMDDSAQKHSTEQIFSVSLTFNMKSATTR